MLTRTAFHLGLAVFAAALALSATSPAHADVKAISATDCQPFYPTLAGEVIFKNNAIFNADDVLQRVMCPINKDANAYWVSGKVKLIAYISAGTKGGKVTCTLYGGGPSYEGAIMSYTKVSSLVPPNAMTTMTFTGIQDFNESFTITGWNMLCSLPSGMSIGGFALDETYDTNL